ncbi:MAG TPA: xanthine dehydrogenase family protein subunit M [Vicinamibacterales bacterium]|nr:xanthine dehydrogenase family protein subunit M [Vicinamibacterales bacterium]
MYPDSFDYYPATSLAEAHRLMAAHPDAKLLAGGQSLIPIMKLRLASPAAVIDIGRVGELRGIATSDGTIRIGALTTHAELASSDVVRRAAPALAEAAAQVGDPAVRNRGTLGGNVAHADPASDLPAVIVALDATIAAIGPDGGRDIPAAAFFTGIMTTALGENEIVAAVKVPVQAAGQGSAYVKFAHPASRYAVIGVAASVSVAKGVCSSARVAVVGLVPHARRLPAVEKALQGQKPGDTMLAEAAARTADDLAHEVSGDIFASAEYRAAVAPVYVRRALAAAFGRASA